LNRKYSNYRVDALKTVAGAAGVALILTPPNAMGASASLPQTISAGGASWFLSDNTSATASGNGLGITDASLAGQPDAYDGAFVMLVNAATYQSPGGTVDLTGTTVTGNSTVMSGLTVSAQYYFDPASPTVRALYTYTNSGVAPITAAIRVGHNLGSDSQAAIVATSSGDATLDATDRWVITGPSSPQSDPILSFVRFGPGAVTSPSAVQVPGPGNGYFGDQYAVTVPAGQTRRVMVFGRLSQNQAAATSSIGTFNTVASLSSAGLLTGLTAQQESEIVNWSINGVPGSAAPAGAPAMGSLGLGLLAVLLGAMAVKFLRWRPAADR
jgi:hypothetical protein